jgi:beta-lactamase regulating signal transducer with metallopeptidase domain
MIELLHYTFRMSLMLAIALTATRLLRRQSAALRHLALASGIFCAAAVPIFNRALPSLDWTPPAEISSLTATLASDPQPTVMSPPVALRQTGSPPNADFEPAMVSPPPQTSITPPSAAAISAGVIMQSIYFAGASLSFGMLLLSLLRLGKISLAAKRVVDSTWTRLVTEVSREYRVRRPVRVLESRSTSILATWGLFCPTIVVPAGSAQWNEERIRIVLCHELAHIRRKDWLVQLAAEIFWSVLWFNPLVWIVGRRLRQESEYACDDAVLNRGVPGSEYAAHLLDLARTLGDPRSVWAPALLMARPSTFEKRFQAMLNPGVKRKVTRSALLFTFGVFLCLAMPVAVLRAVPRIAVVESMQATAVNTVNTVRGAVLAVLQAQTAAPVSLTPNSIEGMVVRLGSDEPISDVDVELRRVEGTPAVPLGPLVLPPGNFSPGAVVRPTYPNPTDIANLRTKADGKFVFTNLKPGLYRLQAARAGGAYFPAEFGQRNPKGKGYDFQFVEGQSMRDVKLHMAPTGSIAGRVVDAEGQPAARVRVMALEATYSLGERTLGIIQAVQTDDRGEYRLFWLPPGGRQ